MGATGREIFQERNEKTREKKAKKDQELREQIEREVVQTNAAATQHSANPAQTSGSAQNNRDSIVTDRVERIEYP